MRQVAIPNTIAGGLPVRPPADHVRRSVAGETMGTTWSVELYASPALTTDAVRELVARELHRLVAQMSHWSEHSELTGYNRSTAGSWVQLPADLFAVIEASLRVSAETGGAFDATVGPLSDVWGFGPAGRQVNAPPVESAIAEGLQRRGYTRVQLDRTEMRVLQPDGVSFDLSSIAKGYAVDRVSVVLHLPSVSSCLVEIGGELKAWGVKPSGEPWWVAIEAPPDVKDFPEIVVAAFSLAIASTGDYRRHFEHNGTRYTHTIDPRTGSPVRHSIASVTVIHRECMLADAFSTALAVMGTEDGIAFADRTGLAAVYAVRNGSGCELRTSRAFADMLQP